MKNKKNFSGQASTLMIGILAAILIFALVGLIGIYLTTQNIINSPGAQNQFKSPSDQNQEPADTTDDKTKNPNALDPNSPEFDSDGDGIPDEAERAMGTDPNKADPKPVFTGTSTPINPEQDSDSDGIPDEAERAMGTDPIKADPKPVSSGTSTPINPEQDSDSDGIPDEAERAMGTDPYKK